MPNIINPTSGTRTFGGTQVTFNYNNSGQDLIVALGLTSTSGVPNFSSVLWNGVAMNTVINANRGSLGYREAIFHLPSASTGTQTLTVNLSAVSGNPCQIIIAGIDNSNGIGVTGSNGLNATPNSQNLTISADSKIFGVTSSFVSVNSITIDGVSETLLGNANTNRYMAGAFSSSNLTAGSKNVSMANGFSQLTNMRVEILDGGGGGGFDPTLPDDGDFFAML